MHLLRMVTGISLGLLMSTTTVAIAATVELNFQYRQGLLSYKQQVHAGIDYAIGYLQDDIEKNPGNIDGRLALAQLLWINDPYNPQKAREHLNTVVQHTPHEAKGHFFLRVIEYFQKNFDQAQIHFSRAIEADQKSAFSYNALAIVETKTGRPSKGIATIEKGVSNLGPQDYFYFNLALIYAQMNQNGQAIKSLQQAIALNPEDSEYYFMLGNLFLLQNDPISARGPLEKAFELNPQNAIALLGVASTYKEENNFSKAIELGEQAQQLDPNNPVIEEELAEFRAAYQQWRESEGPERTP